MTEKKYTGRGGWHGGGRPKGSGKGLDASVHFFCTKEEREELVLQSVEEDISLSALVRSKIF